MKFAAIDVGSNAVRLLLSRVFENEHEPPYFRRESLIRIPLRLGDDAFTNGQISDEKVDMFIKTFKGFKHLIDAYQPLDYLACATSAMREAANGRQIVDTVRRKCKVNLDIISGEFEAEIIKSNRIESRLARKGAFLYIDVGGGSTELTLFSADQTIASRSFKIGTVRLLKDLVPRKRWKDMKKWIEDNVDGIGEINGVGSGGNISKLFQMARKKHEKPLLYKDLKTLEHFISFHTYDERVRRLGLKPDRADVIVPAVRIYSSVMKWAGIRKIYVPEIGLADGIIRLLYDRHKNGKPLPVNGRSSQ